MLWNDLGCSWIRIIDFEKSWFLASRWRLRTANDLSKHDFVVLAHNAFMLWCSCCCQNMVRSTLLQPGDPSGAPMVLWPDDPKWPPNGPFGGHLLHEDHLDHQSVIGRMSRDYLGKFSSQFWFHMGSLSLKTSWNPSFMTWKWSKIYVLRIDPGSFTWCLEVIGNALEWFRILMDQIFWFSEIMIFDLEMTSPHGKWQQKMRFRCAGAQCHYVA